MNHIQSKRAIPLCLGTRGSRQFSRLLDMTRKRIRIVEAAVIEKIGPVTARELIAMPKDRWGHLRDRITDARQGKDGLTAHCMACDSPVFITTRFGCPLFNHYAGGDPNCPWRHGRNMKPDQVRARQYKGQQESKFHRLMCEQLGELVALDQRYITHKISEYLPPSENRYGRFPDIYVEWENYGPFVVEFQMSGTFQTEISARCKHYEWEDMPLLWVLFGIDPSASLPQSVRDVIRRHRGNAFVLDHTACEASRDARTLVLKCYLQNGEGFDPPKLVRFDELTVPRSQIPYFEDRIVKLIKEDIQKYRIPWFRAVRNWDHSQGIKHLDRTQTLLVAAAFSLVATANGNERNYASKHPNIRSMLNTYLSTGIFSHVADLLTTLIKSTSAVALLDGSVGVHLQRYRADRQVGPNSVEWQLLRKLFPEALDPIIREELDYLDALPEWASLNRGDSS